MIDLTAHLENRDLGSVVGDVRQLLQQTPLPAGVTYEIGGQYESQQSSFRELLSVMALALAAVFTVLVVQFKSFRPAIVVLAVAPLSLVGVFAMLKLTGTPLNVSSFMGLILMIGLVVKNGIILFEYVQKLREDGLPLEEAHRAGRPRAAHIDDYARYLRFAPARFGHRCGRGIAETAGPCSDRWACTFDADHASRHACFVFAACTTPRGSSNLNRKRSANRA
jgi:Cu/Ag efflux pump CusA